MNHKPPEPLMRMSELCRHYRCDRSQVSRWIKDGMPYRNLNARRPTARKSYRFKLSEVEAWLDAKESPTGEQEEAQLVDSEG